MVSFNFRMDAIRITVLNYKLRFLDDDRAGDFGRRSTAKPRITLKAPQSIPRSQPYTICSRLLQHTDALAKYLASRGMKRAFIIGSFHLQPAFQSWLQER
jgi:hypothetical protein